MTPDRKSEGREGDASPAADMLLRTTREQKKLSVDDVAHVLHLDRKAVIELESGDYDLIGAGVFVRGHLRSYARLLELPEADVLNLYQPIDQGPEEFRTLSLRRELKTGSNLPNFILWALFALIALLVLIYFLADDSKDEKFTSTAAVFVVEPVAGVQRVAINPPSKPVQIDSAAIAASDLQPEAAVLPAEPVFLAAPAEVEPIVPAPAVDIPDPVRVSLKLVFTAECWIEIADSRRRVLYGLEKAGSVRTFEGEPPFRFFLGDADAVKITVGGSDYVVEKSVRSGNNSARFSITADDIAGGNL